MNIFRKIDIANYKIIQDDINAFVSTLNLNNDGVFASIDGVNIHERCLKSISLISAIIELGLINYWVYTVIVVTSHDIPVHKDEGLYHTLLLPLKNTEGSLTTFYRSFEEPQLRYQDNGIPYYHYEKKQFDTIRSIEIDTPILMNVSIPHGVTVGHKTPRLTLSLRFSKEADETMKKFYG